MAAKSKPWRMEATFADGQDKTIAYSTERAAHTSAEFEISLGAVKVRIWDSRTNEEPWRWKKA